MNVLSKKYLIYGHVRWYENRNVLGIDIIEEYTGKSVCLMVTDSNQILFGKKNKITTIKNIERKVNKRFKNISQELIKELKEIETGGSLEKFKDMCLEQNIEPKQFIVYKERYFEEKFERKLKSIKDNEMTKEEVYKWLEKKKRNSQENIKKVKEVEVKKDEEEAINKSTRKEKKTQIEEIAKIKYNLLHNIKGTILAEDETCENNLRIKKIAQICNRQLISKETGIYFIQQELNIIHESVDIAIALFGKKVINIEDLEKNLMTNFCLNDRNIKRIVSFQLDKDVDQLFFDKWFRKGIITKETYLASLQKIK
ncbi:hypothetical protein EHI8A_140240 [Entamoeba histolytica HM-1:IMSS-B]|uniref:Uncharacterized protein n=5 Tax=Entamoeba histolytica TaxID=5759 RepID=C4M393_ENTH1|nr:hypothetical protein EHI_106290 [Entamoeba histolytica HM-1:IMSS]EAL51622.2 hypothetical protein EHI_106290 [Entamoeba histolytica HM-1:IMSS]EMD44639.1 Hypothetical protein EHI5A_050200 [Entamoeba histolytica KU27]EMH75832.1 hypothetical protein EHI8A_140240 [Entamoeba histolytica HM-1:IMSS-B]ENY64940.1 hypothetical protein EHI7A_119790 [Entamoeba histolytica HM-1:IMSS-A]|eukprot:XP_657008.2 hypothetical protein EHI_106290 [Entamoeba histolytica HM-1:IMSS]